MDFKSIRTAFIEFFQEKAHKIVSSAPIVVKDDPTLMFTNAGMNQFKDYFLGNKKDEVKRAADTQKCLRVSGKHNDLEDVGLDTYHHTMFEMLGNWSFGDYFKKEAIEWAWELLTEVYKLPKDRLYITVFEGDSKESLEGDEESREYWKNHIAEDRILNGSKKDNFWEMGDTGPCGPCSEIHIDLRSDDEIQKQAGDELVNQDHPQVVEIWNLVFIQFNRMKSGQLEDLPEQHVDTGMGLERLVMAIQNKPSNYDTDVFQPIMKKLEGITGIAYGNSEETDIAIRVIVDHIRAITFAISDGQLPSNVKAGYVIRRILRRAVRYGFNFLNVKEPFLFELVEVLSNQFSEVFPEVDQQKELIERVIKEEETTFLRTLELGLKRLDSISENLSSMVIDGKIAFELYDTYGFPLDLTSLIARERGLSIDEKGFEEAMSEQKNRSKQDAQTDKGDWIVVNKGENVVFRGYDQLETSSKILRYREVEEKGKKAYQVILDQTPFYAESGGQKGDSGFLTGSDEKIDIYDTKKENDLIIHFSKKLPSDLNAGFQAFVNKKKRSLTENNHTATHLLHAALRDVLGDHVQQKGSLVSDKVLRFDFSHFSKMETEEISRVEEIVNTKIRENIERDIQENVPISEAKEMGAMALFGEKYGDFVRVVTFDKDYSVELCGGTHVPFTGQIGFFKIISESSIASGIRRIEAITSVEADRYINEKLDELHEIKEKLNNPKKPVDFVESLLEDHKKLQKQLEAIQIKESNHLKEILKSRVSNQNGLNLILEEVELPSKDALKNISFQLKNEIENLIMVLAARYEGNPQIGITISENLVKEYGLNAGQLVRSLAAEIKGGGGGQAFFATAGGKDASGLPNVIRKAKEMIEEQLAAHKN
ncbi:MAG: alanine--tRNA ligase [Bacteroidota bacterium]